MAGAGNFLITSNYPTDKIVWMYEGEATTDEFGTIDEIIPNTLGAEILATGIWTVDNWQTVYMATTTTHNGQIYSRFSMLRSNDSEFEFRAYCANPDGTDMDGATVKYRLWGFLNEATTQNVFVEETAGQSENKFIKDSRLGYPKLFMEGFADASQGTQTVYHNLGFKPFVEIWYELPDGWYQLDYMDFTTNGTEWTVHNTDSVLEFNGDGYTNYNYYYRIYADE